MKKGGNFRIFELEDGMRGRLIYSTHTNRHVGDESFFLGIDEECILGIYLGTPDNIGAKIWTNIHTGPLRAGDRLGRGVMYRDTKRNAFMILQPADGNLVVYDGSDFTDSSRIPLWASNTAGGASFDFHLDVRPNGMLKLTEDGPPKRVYYTKDLFGSVMKPHRYASACFHVALDPCSYEPTAVPRPCPEDIEIVMKEAFKQSQAALPCPSTMANVPSVSSRMEISTSTPALISCGTLDPLAFISLGHLDAELRMLWLGISLTFVHLVDFYSKTVVSSKVVQEKLGGIPTPLEKLVTTFLA